jgi:hypothetical protein
VTARFIFQRPQKGECAVSLVSYNVTINPSEPGVQISIDSITATQLTVKIDSLGDFSMSLTPEGNIVEKILSEIVIPVANLIAKEIPGKARDGIEGQTFTQDFDNPIGYSFSVEGVEVNVQAQTLNLSNYNGMLMATGTVSVS